MAAAPMKTVSLTPLAALAGGMLTLVLLLRDRGLSPLPGARSAGFQSAV